LLRLLIVGVRWPPETFIRRKISRLSEQGVRVTVATSVSQFRLEFAMPGVRILRLSHPNYPWIISILRLVRDGLVLLARRPRFVPSIISAIRKQQPMAPKVIFAKLRTYIPLMLTQPDVVHFEWNSAAIDNLPMFDIWNCPVIISCRGSQINIAPHNLERASIREGLRATFQRAAATHCVSEAIKQEARQYGLDPAKAWVIRPAVDPDFFYPSDRLKSEDAFKLITTGSLIWGKGFEYALLAVRRVIDRGFRLHFRIIGEGPEKQRLLYTIQDLGLQEHVRLLGQLSPAAVRSTLQEADVFVLSSLSEGISNAVLEAMACGLPVVTTDCGGMREAVQDGVEGFVVPIRQPKLLAHALMQLADDPELRERMGQAGRKRILCEFTLERQAGSFIQMLETVLRDKKALSR
jgi:colanic acid/amylovoran biosynthesis glycosyltransferase